MNEQTSPLIPLTDLPPGVFDEAVAFIKAHSTLLLRDGNLAGSGTYVKCGIDSEFLRRIMWPTNAAHPSTFELAQKTHLVFTWQMYLILWNWKCNSSHHTKLECLSATRTDQICSSSKFQVVPRSLEQYGQRKQCGMCLLILSSDLRIAISM